MMSFTLPFIMLISFMFLLINTPVILSVLIILLTISMAMIISMNSLTSWLAYLLILIFISGMMIVFVYLSSLATNELNPEMTKMIMSTFSCMVIYLIILYSFPKFKQTMNPNESSFVLEQNLKMMYKLYETYLSYLSVGLMLYLLTVLIVTVKITTYLSAPLRANK